MIANSRLKNKTKNRKISLHKLFFLEQSALFHQKPRFFLVLLQFHLENECHTISQLRVLPGQKILSCGNFDNAVVMAPDIKPSKKKNTISNDLITPLEWYDQNKQKLKKN